MNRSTQPQSPSASFAGTDARNLPNVNARVTCIVLNWNGWRDTVDCLEVLRESTYSNMETMVVDNGSTDDSVSRIRDAHPRVAIIETHRNLGFAGGNNAGIRHALAQGAEYVWLLNNDTTPAPDALSALVAKATSDSRLGAVASVSYYADSPSRVEAWAGAHVNLWYGSGRNSTQPRPDEWFHSLNGTSILISKAALEDAGLLDEGFFLYWEDTEFCLRLRKRGWRLGAAQDSKVLHKVSASTGGNKIILDRYQTASGLRLLKLHSPSPAFACVLFLSLRFGKRLLGLEFNRCRSVWRGVQDYREMLPVSPQIRECPRV
jgi:GT2 family glycosyltransferase